MEYKYSFKTKLFAYTILHYFKNNKLNEKILDKITFLDLIYLSNCVMKKSEYEKLISKIIELQEKRIKNKVREGQKLKIAFLCDLSSIWAFDKMIEQLRKEKRIELYAIVPLIAPVEGEEKTSSLFHAKHNKDVIEFLKKKKLKFYVVKEKEDAKWGNKLPDILFSQRPYEGLYMQENFNLHNIHVSCMQMFVPYSFWVDKTSDIIFATDYMKIYSKIFCPSKVHMDYFQNTVEIDNTRLLFSGYPKVDCYYSNQSVKESDAIWKHGKGKIHIIYAPGFVEAAKHSTFDLNYKMMLDIAKKSKETVSWVIRLHPMMAESCIRHRIFKNLDEWNHYINEWNSLENASVSMNGSYEAIFKTSDGMIMDSVSFLPSYQYTKKPLLLLTRKTQEFNKLGRMLKEVVYTAQGNKRDQIEAFINDVLIEKQDEKKAIRDTFFEENLDYYKQNKMLASECIANCILNYFK